MFCFLFCYEEQFQRTCAFAYRNPFQEYDDAKFRPRFRLIVEVRCHKTVGQDILQNLIDHVGKYHEGVFCYYKICEAMKHP